MQVHINDKFNSIEVSFPKKPAKSILQLLDQMDFRWSPTKKHWYRKNLGKALAEWLRNSGSIPAAKFRIILASVKAASKAYNNDELKWLEQSLSRLDLSGHSSIELNITPQSKARIAALSKLSCSPIKKASGKDRMPTSIDKKRCELTYAQFAHHTPTLWGNISVRGKAKFGQFRPEWNNHNNSLTYQYYTEDGKKGTGGFTLRKAYQLLKAGNLSTVNDFVTLSGLDHYPYDNDPYADDNDGPGLGKAFVNNDVYQVITDMVLKIMESGKELPWRKPWGSVERYGIPATNFVTKKPYRGINALLLNFLIPAGLGKNWDIPYFLTFRQVEQLGGQVKKNAKGYFVTYFQMVYKKGDQRISEAEFNRYMDRCADNGNELMENGKNICDDLKDFAVLRYYKVFNAKDIDGIDWKLPKVEKRTNFERIAAGDAIIQHYPAPKPKFINVDPDRAFYRPGTDQVNMPPEDSFASEQFYYSVFFHELIHSTGHSRRLNRDLSGGWGSDEYRFEELVAELGASFLCGESGILYHTMNNTAAYLKGYRDSLIGAMKKDNKFFFRAAGRAQAAADFILQRDKDGVPKYLADMKEALQIRSNPSVKPETMRKARKAVKAVKAARFAKKTEMAKSMSGPEPAPASTFIDELPDDEPSPAVPVKIDGILSGSEILRKNFKTLDFNGDWGEFMQHPGANLKVTVYGKPKNGKTSFSIQFADYLSAWGPVLYVLADQGVFQPTKQLIADMKVGNNDGLHWASTRKLSELEKWIATGKFQFVFVDLVNNFEVSAKEFEAMMQRYPDTGFILVMESRKDGDFKGEQKWTHIVDAIVKVENFIATNSGRYGYGEYIVFPERVAQMQE